jgi:hypothetical protein
MDSRTAFATSVDRPVTYDGHPRVVEQVDADGVQVAWLADRTTETQLATGETVTLGAESYVAHIADGTRLQLVADRSVYVAQTAQIAAFGLLVSVLWGVFIVAVLSVVFLTGFAFLPSRCQCARHPVKICKGNSTQHAVAEDSKLI